MIFASNFCGTTRADPFVVCDHPLAIYDPDADRVPGIGWFSSRLVEVSMPLDPELCLLLVRRKPELVFTLVSPETVRQMNLKTYASAERFVLAHDEQPLSKLLDHVMQSPKTVAQYAPKPFALVEFERYEGAEQPHAVNVVRPPAKPTRGHRKPRQPESERVRIECPFCHHELFHAWMAKVSGRDDRYRPHCLWAVDPLAIDWKLEDDIHAVCRCGRSSSGASGTSGHPDQTSTSEPRSWGLKTPPCYRAKREQELVVVPPCIVEQPPAQGCIDPRCSPAGQAAI